MKVQLKTFRVTWSESPLRRFVGVPLHSWGDANEALAAMLTVAPVRGRAHRTGFSLEWADGQRYVGGIHLHADLTALERPLSNYLRARLECVAGHRRPEHLTAVQYLAFLRAQGEEVVVRATRLLRDYDLE